MTLLAGGLTEVFDGLASALLLVGFAGTVLAVPWLIGVAYRLRGIKAPGLGSRAVASMGCAFIALLAGGSAAGVATNIAGLYVPN